MYDIEDVPLPQLAEIVCRGLMKFKISFRVSHGCTVTKYTQQHMQQATQLILGTVLAVRAGSLAV